MSIIDPNTLNPVERYRLMIDCVVPRPIAWVSTIHQGVVNLAPFSFFNGVTASPPTVMLSIGPRNPAKDTLVNLRATKEAVIHLVDERYLEACHQSGGEYAAGISEAEQLGLSMLPAEKVQPPRIADCAVAMECRYVQELSIGEPASTVVFLEVVLVHCADAVLGKDGFPDPALFQPVGRLGERAYLHGEQWRISDLDKQHVPPELARPRPPRPPQ